MESNDIISNIELTIQQGGMIEFEETGVYPEFLIFHSAQLRRVWRFKKINEIQNGVLKVNSQIAFYYFFDGIGCKIQIVVGGIVTKEWAIEKIKIEMRD